MNYLVWSAYNHGTMPLVDVVDTSDSIPIIHSRHSIVFEVSDLPLENKQNVNKSKFASRSTKKQPKFAAHVLKENYSSTPLHSSKFMSQTRIRLPFRTKNGVAFC